MSDLKNMYDDFSLLYAIVANDDIAITHQSLSTYRMAIAHEISNCKDRAKRIISKANEASKQQDAALGLQNVVPSVLEDKLKAERISLMRELICDFEGGWDSDEYIRMLKERIDIEINGI